MWYLGHHLTAIAGFLLCFVFFAYLGGQRRSSTSTVAWMLTILFVPYIGVPLYLMLGGRKMSQLFLDKDPIYPPPAKPPVIRAGYLAERVLVSAGVPAARGGNRVRLLTTGEEAYAELLRMVDEAKRWIGIETFILGNDEVGEAILTRLGQRASQGIEVRLLLDGFGCLWTKRSRLRALERCGGKVTFFMPLLHLPFRGSSNLRNHRKIVVVDGTSALTGGMNIAHEYMGPVPDPSRWRDIALRIDGPTVSEIDCIFQSDWRFAYGGRGQQLHPSGELPAQGPDEVQVVGSGPDAQGDPLYDAFVSEVYQAERRIWIATPYFVPDDALTRSLELACRRGVDVRILLPARSNHRLADWARGSSLRSIQAAGGRVLLHQEGMLHAKATLIDERTAIVTSANLDMRSLFLNFEIGVFLYTPGAIADLSLWFERLAMQAEEGTDPVGRARALVENTAQLISPLL